MKKIILILLVAINMTLIFGQEWFDKLYHESTIESQMNDFSNLWLGNTFQGYIGRKYQRIEIRFLTISKDSKNPLKYYVVGKSKVNNNICDFKGEISIEKIKTLIDKTAYGDTPDISMGMLWGKYEFREDSLQNHVGIFKGDLYVKFDIVEGGKAEPFRELYYDDENITFIGTWTEYSSTDIKKCNWGWNIPPKSEPDLFSILENGFYLINSEYFERGWKSYALANYWIVVPKDFRCGELINKLGKNVRNSI
jgi:hypothetical protein